MQFSHSLSTPIPNSFRVEQVRGMFDLAREAESREEFTVELPEPEEEWMLGAIVGPSGSGKTSIARAAFGEAVYTPGEWPRERAVIDGFGEASLHEITSLLTAVGFGSPPAWLRPYHVLSGGERFRADLARALLTARTGDGGEPGLVVFDEYTSVVDRRAAEIGSLAVNRALRAGRPRVRLVVVTCHYDVLPWLQTDWTLDMAGRRLARGSLPRPRLQLEAIRCRRACWPLFARHHYLSGRLAHAAECYLALLAGEPAAFCAVVGMFGRKGCKRITRLVTLPVFQGVGIGSRLLETVCRDQAERGFRTHLTTSHPAMIAACRRSPLWRTRGVKKPGSRGRQECGGRKFVSSASRCVVSFEWRGEAA